MMLRPQTPTKVDHVELQDVSQPQMADPSHSDNSVSAVKKDESAPEEVHREGNEKDI